MRRNRAKTVDTAPTSFARWRILMRYTQEEAAQKLGKSRRSIAAYEQPDPKTGKPVTPSYADRVLMDLLAKGIPHAPWPE